MRLLLVTLEYAHGTFSGNGVYAVSTVRALRAAGHDVHVVCGAPRSPPPPPTPADGAWPLPLPVWGCLDRHCAYEAFGEAAAGDGALQAWVAAFAPQLCLGVDFSSLGVFHALWPQQQHAPPYVYLNWRVYNLTDAAHEALEAAAGRTAVACVSLSEVDARVLRARLLPPGLPLAVIPPPLREDVRALASAAAACSSLSQPRTLLCCVVRLSPEKEPERFVALVEALAASGALSRLGVTPALVGAPRDAYGAALAARLRACAPSAEVITDFLPPAQLGLRVFSRAALNVHPPCYESFGLTVLEAAAWGTPSLLHAGGVGAAEVLRPEEGLAFGADMGAPPAALAARVEALLDDVAALRRVADAARAAALAHTEAANAAATARVLASVLAGRPLK